MFSSRFLRLPAAIRGITHSPACKPPLRFFQHQPITNTPRSLARNFQQSARAQRRGQRAYYRYDPSGPSRAKPLITAEQLQKYVRSPQFIGILVLAFGSGTVFYVSNLETVPVSGRQRFNCHSEEDVEAEGQMVYRQIMQNAISQGALLPPSDRRSRMVARVMSRLISASGLEHVNWEVHVINSAEKNAFVIPGGKVFVFTGMLPICRTDDGLATVLGHEIAHNLAQHQAESMSSLELLRPVRWLLFTLDATGITMGLGRVLGDIALDLGIMRRRSRMQESEADYIGLMMMAKACYNPDAAVGVWQRMEAAQEEEVPEWLSTHPSNVNRVERIRGWLDKAREERDVSGCAATIGYHRDFQSVVQGMNDGLGGGFWR